MWGIDPIATTGREWPVTPGLSLTLYRNVSQGWSAADPLVADGPDDPQMVRERPGVTGHSLPVVAMGSIPHIDRREGLSPGDPQPKLPHDEEPRGTLDHFSGLRESPRSFSNTWRTRSIASCACRSFRPSTTKSSAYLTKR